VLGFDLTTFDIVFSDAWTLIGKKLAGKDRWITDLHGERNGRIRAIEEELLRIFNYYQPLLIASESPFINSKFPQAGLALTVVVCAIRQAVMNYDLWKSLDLIDPPTVKMAVGAPGNAPKEIVKEKIMQLPNLNYVGTTPIALLDEHSIDALAVAICRLRTLLEVLCLSSPHSGWNSRPK
jgi:Holliday junction resolvasome RuvABC endonuclease subunit